MVRAGVGIGVVMAPLARRLPDLVPVLPVLQRPVLPVGLTAHRALRASRRLQRVFDLLASGPRAWGDDASA